MNPHFIGTFGHHHCGFRLVSVAETNRVRAVIVFHSSQEGFFLTQKASPTQTGAVPERGRDWPWIDS